MSLRIGHHQTIQVKLVSPRGVLREGQLSLPSPGLRYRSEEEPGLR